MAVVVGTNTGFVSSAPTADPAGTNSSIDGGSLANKDTSPSSGAVRVIELGWYVSGNTSSVDADYQIGLYDHDGTNDKPDNYLGGSLTESTGTGNGWKKVTGLSIPIDASTDYWVCVQVDVADGVIGTDYGNITGTREIDNPSSPTDLPDPWNNEGTGYDDYAYTFYAVYDTAAVYSKNISSDSYIQKDGYESSLSSDSTIANIKTDLLAYWNADKDGSFQDSVNSYDGTLVNSPVFTTAGKIGGAYTFSEPNSQHVEVSTLTQGYTDYSVQVWFKTTDTTANQFFIGNKQNTQDRFEIYSISSTALAVRERRNGAGDSYSTFTVADYADGNWHHLVLTSKQNESVRVYYDNTIVKTLTAYNDTIASGRTFVIGGIWSDDGTSVYKEVNGTLDEIGLWERQISTTEVNTLYNEGLGTQYPFDPVAYLYSDSEIALSTYTANIGSDMQIGRIFDNSLVSDSEILNGVGVTYLVSPTSGSSQGGPVVFTWRVPSDSGLRDLHSFIEIDTVNTFDSVNLIRKKSYVDSGFQYFNGTWITYPVTGVPELSYLTNARISVSLDVDTYYWRVRAEVTDV